MWDILGMFGEREIEADGLERCDGRKDKQVMFVDNIGGKLFILLVHRCPRQVSDGTTLVRCWSFSPPFSILSLLSSSSTTFVLAFYLILGRQSRYPPILGPSRTSILENKIDRLLSRLAQGHLVEIL
jgi:hypothetical protein